MNSKISLILATFMMGVGLTIILPSVGSACVWVNGVPLSYEEIRYAEQLHGMQIACGNYLFDAKTGAWWDLNRQNGGYLGEGYSQQRQGSSRHGGSGEYSVEKYSGGYVGGDGDCTTIFIPSSDYTYLGDGC